MKLVLNIGLARPDGGFDDTNEVLQALNDAGLFIRSSEVLESDTEPTLVVSADFTPVKVDHSLASVVAAVAEALGQDCIAAWLPEHKQGRLLGPRAAAWGDFNPAFFIGLDGKRLA